MGFSVMLWGAENMVPAEYWCPYGTLKFCLSKKEKKHLKQSKQTSELKWSYK